MFTATYSQSWFKPRNFSRNTLIGNTILQQYINFVTLHVIKLDAFTKWYHCAAILEVSIVNWMLEIHSFISGFYFLATWIYPLLVRIVNCLVFMVYPFAMSILSMRLLFLTVIPVTESSPNLLYWQGKEEERRKIRSSKAERSCYEIWWKPLFHEALGQPSAEESFHG